MMKEFIIDVPTIESDETVIENVQGFDIRQITITTNANGSKVRIMYEEGEQ